MRKTFLTFCAAALALLAVSSCGKLEDGLNNLKGEVADLKDRVEKLEKKLNDEVQALQTTMATLATKEEVNTALNALKTALENKDAEFANAIQGLVSNDSDLADQLEELTALFGETAEGLKEEVLAQLAEAVASVTVKVIENEDGDVVITLANGKSFTVAKPDANANNTGLVTVNEDGEWCVVLEDGTLKSLDAKVGVEELEFSVSSENELLYSVNGGEPVGTGAYVSDWDGTVVTDFYEDEDFVYITIGGTEYTLVKATESTTEFNLLAGKTYFENEETKVIGFTVTDVKSAFVASVPKGWEVELDFAKNTLTVTAPAEDEGATEGNVEVWLLGNDGVVKAAFLPVVCGPAVITIDVDPQTNVVAMTFNQMMIEDYDGSVAMRTPEVYYGATLASEFQTKKEEYLASLAQLVWDPTSGVHTNCDAGNPDNFDLRATSFNGTVAELAYNADFNAEYVVWAIIPEWTEDWTVANPNDFVMVYHQMNAMNFEAVADVVDADLSIELLDTKANGFYAFYVSPYNEWVLEGLQMGNFAMEQLLSGAFGNEMPCILYEGTTLNVKLSEIGWSEAWLAEGGKNMLAPLTTSIVGIVPAYDGKELTDYTFEDVVVKKVPLKELEFGSSVAVSYEENKDYTTFEIKVTAPEDLLFAMYEIYEPGEAPETDAEVLECLEDFNSFDEFTYNEYEGELVIVKESDFREEPGRNFEVVLFLVGADGKMKVERINTSTKALPMNDALSLSIEAYIDELDNVAAAKFTLAGEGAVKMYYTANMANPAGYSFDEYSYLISAYESNSENWTEVDLTQVTMDQNGAFVLTGFTVVENATAKRTNYVHAILVDADGKLAGVFSSNKLDIPAGGLNPANPS